MCTVSFVTSNDKFIITSNRDEQLLRPAIEPKNYVVNGKNILFPKDPKAGGTWYAVAENGTILVLLNGADEKHEVKLPYRKSRGIIVLDIISSNSAIDEWKNIDLENIEPFTLVLFEFSHLWQLRWNGMVKSTKNLKIDENHIWSSSTLYPKEIREKRAIWFQEFLAEKATISAEEMYNFHRYTKNENSENGLIINRNDNLKTLSITQSVVDETNVSLNYYDLIEGKDFSTKLITL